MFPHRNGKNAECGVRIADCPPIVDVSLRETEFIPRSRMATVSRRGLTLVELLIASAIMSIMAGAMSALAISMRQATEYTNDRGTALQHGRVSLERINQILSTA